MEDIEDSTTPIMPLALREPDGLDLSVARAPDVVLEEAHKAAAALKKVIDAKPKKVVFGDETYLEFEDWQTVGRFYGISPRVTRTSWCVYGSAEGFEATADAVHFASGRIVSTAEAMCLNDEEKWSARPKYEWHYVRRSGGMSKDDPGKNELIWEKGTDGKSRPKKLRIHVGTDSVPLFQLRSMAQTRAMAKAMRGALAWVVVLAGYRPTPAEELPAGATVIDVTPTPPDAAGANNRAVVLDRPDPDTDAADLDEVVSSIMAMRLNLKQTPGRQAVESARFLGPNVALEDAPIDKLVALAAHLTGQLPKQAAS